MLHSRFFCRSIFAIWLNWLLLSQNLTLLCLKRLIITLFTRLNLLFNLLMALYDGLASLSRSKTVVRVDLLEGARVPLVAKSANFI